MSRRERTWILGAAALPLLALAACVLRGPESVPRHLWWSGLGPVLPHDTFPGECSQCHLADDWQSLKPEFAFDHERETGTPLLGAHARAQCLRCHNDRGPAGSFARLGCAGCHEDLHLGQLGPDCARCHQESSWEPSGMLALHQHTRFPLVGAHAVTQCRRCHPAAEAGRFVPTDTECVTCHQSDLARTSDPDHVGVGWIDRCDRCHLTRTWLQAEQNE